MQQDTKSDKWAAQRAISVMATLIFTLLTAVEATLVRAAEQAASGGNVAHIGEAALTGIVDITTLSQPNAIISDLSGPKLHMVSPRYDMAAPRIHAEARKGGQPVRFKMTDAVATGGVTIVVRNEAAKQTTTLTCDKAVYHATPQPKDRGQIDLTGHVHSVMSDPTMAQPMVVTADSGTITFPDAESTRVKLHSNEPEGGSITGAFREPPTKKK